MPEGFGLLVRRHTLVATGGKIVWAGRVVAALISLVFLLSAFMKIRGGPEVAEGIRHLGLPESMLLPLSILEAACATHSITCRITRTRATTWIASLF